METLAVIIGERVGNIRASMSFIHDSLQGLQTLRITSLNGFEENRIGASLPMPISTNPLLPIVPPKASRNRSPKTCCRDLLLVIEAQKMQGLRSWASLMPYRNPLD